MTQTINIAWGVCTPMRYEQHVKPIVEEYGVKVLGYEEYSKSNYGTGVKFQVSDAQGAYAEYWVCRSGMFSLISKPIEPRNIKWAAKWQDVPVQKGCESVSANGMIGRMPEPGRKRQPRARRQRTTRRTRQDGGVLGTIAKWFR